MTGEHPKLAAPKPRESASTLRRCTSAMTGPVLGAGAVMHTCLYSKPVLYTAHTYPYNRGWCRATWTAASSLVCMIATGHWPVQDSSRAVKLWGEDALLDWPGAMQPVIHDRDAHMAQAIWAAAQGLLPVVPAMSAHCFRAA